MISIVDNGNVNCIEFHYVFHLPAESTVSIKSDMSLGKIESRFPSCDGVVQSGTQSRLRGLQQHSHFIRFYKIGFAGGPPAAKLLSFTFTVSSWPAVAGQTKVANQRQVLGLGGQVSIAHCLPLCRTDHEASLILTHCFRPFFLDIA